MTVLIKNKKPQHVKKDEYVNNKDSGGV